MSLEDFSEEVCIKKIKAVSSFYTNNEKERDFIFEKSSEYFANQYTELREKGKNEKIARNSSLMKTIEHMTKMVNEMYSEDN